MSERGLNCVFGTPHDETVAFYTMLIMLIQEKIFSSVTDDLQSETFQSPE